MEILDLYDRNGNPTGKEWDRADVDSIPHGLFRLVCEVLVKHIDGDFLLMHRDFSKKWGPGLWEASAGGSALKGESPIECIQRELFEETGIKSEKFIEMNCSIREHNLYHSYLTIVDCAKDSIVLQKGETIGYRWVSESEFFKFLESDFIIKTQKERYRCFLQQFQK